MHNAGCAGCKSFLDSNIASVVIGLKVTNQSFALLVSFSKSEVKLKFLLQRGDFSTTKNKLVSSAKSLMFDLMPFTMSLIYRKHKSGEDTYKLYNIACFPILKLHMIC